MFALFIPTFKFDKRNSIVNKYVVNRTITNITGTERYILYLIFPQLVSSSYSFTVSNVTSPIVLVSNDLDVHDDDYENEPNIYKEYK
jgi:hypothetical protein